MKQQSKRRAERLKSNPEYRERVHKKQTAYQVARYICDPEFRKAKKEYARELYANDPEYRANKDAKQLERYRANPHYRVDVNISSQIRQSLKDGKQGQSWEVLVGYSLTELTRHLELLFEEGMNWDNYGEWHIDHRVPRSWFAYESVDDPTFRECWALSNLQPKWGAENISKGNRFAD